MFGPVVRTRLLGLHIITVDEGGHRMPRDRTGGAKPNTMLLLQSIVMRKATVFMSESGVVVATRRPMVFIGIF